MPRRSPDSCNEMRITFGQYERDLINDVVEDIQLQRYMSATGDLLSPFSDVIGYLAIGAGVAYGANTFQNGDINTTINQLFSEGGRRFLNDNFVTNTITEFVDLMEGILFPNRDA